MRQGGRAADELRPVRFTRRYTEHAEGSVLCEFGATRVLCRCATEVAAKRAVTGRRIFEAAKSRNVRRQTQR